MQSILPRAPLERVDRGICLEAIDAFPLVDFGFLPDSDIAIVATGCNHAFEFGMGPGELPARPLVSEIEKK